MTFEKLSDQVRQLIGENEQRKAADLLAQALRDKNPALFNIALVQQGNIKKLADQSAIGILATDEANRERAKINAALLHLSDEYARLFESSVGKRNLPRWVLPVAGIVVVIVVMGWLIKNTSPTTHYPDTFDLEVRLHEPGGEQAVITEGQVNLRLNDDVPQEPHALDARGTAVFRVLSSTFRGDTIHLLYFPPRARKFTVVQQSALTTTGENQTIRFTIQFSPDTTVFEATLRDAKGRAVKNAKITVDGNLHSISDENGYFKVAIPKASGAVANFVIEKDGVRRFVQDMTISGGHRLFPIE